MKISIDWQRPIQLQSGHREGLIYKVDLDLLERTPGVYIFARRWSRSFEALYVGQSRNIRSRVKSQVDRVKLMRHLEQAKSGKRVVIVGYPNFKGGQQVPKVLNVTERSLIRHFIAEGHDLVNQQGVRIREHEITSAGRLPKAFVPAVMYLERKLGK